MPMLDFAVKTEVFEGPLELLIDLVEKRKLLINDISLAEVTDEYMRRVSEMQEMSLPNTAQFVALAATLLLIKSKSLLPVLELTSEEEATIEDLEERLRQYQVYREAGKYLQERFGQAVMQYPEMVPARDIVFSPDDYCTLDNLAVAIRNVINELPKVETKPTATIKPTISLEEMMARLQQRIEKRLRTKFSELRALEPERKNLIVGFLAILELFKQGSVVVKQDSHFSDIEIELDKTPTPRYY
jgi:segregation and condensation protein A